MENQQKEILRKFNMRIMKYYLRLNHLHTRVFSKNKRYFQISVGREDIINDDLPSRPSTLTTETLKQ